LIEAMVLAVSERSYAETTIADVVRHARVSKRTFYEHFPDKEACFLAAYEGVAQHMLARITSAAEAETSPEKQIAAGARAYFSALEEHPGVTRAFLSDVHAAGPAALALRRKIHQQFADTLRELVERNRKLIPGARPLSRELATALVGGINELLLLAIDEGRTQRLREVADTALQLVWAVLSTLAPPGYPIPSFGPKQDA
jgi:AcrR family transcriptional regulator